jgi:sulfite exporter TauE/SafE
MDASTLFPVFLVGLLGSVHCVGMCGGIVGAFSVATPERRPFPVPVLTQSRSPAIAMPSAPLRSVAYNAGRITSYAAIGALAGGLAGGARTVAGLASFQTAGYWVANLMLVALGLYLLNAWSGLARLELAGQALWRRIRPLTTHFLPADSAGKLFGLGMLWGWLPCGMVYGVLLTAMAAGSAVDGALVMLAFGAGTLPALTLLGVAGSRLSAWSRRPGVRLAAGLLVLGFGVLGLTRAATGLELGWAGLLCIAVPA